MPGTKTKKTTSEFLKKFRNPSILAAGRKYRMISSESFSPVVFNSADEILNAGNINQDKFRIRSNTLWFPKRTKQLGQENGLEFPIGTIFFDQNIFDVDEERTREGSRTIFLDRNDDNEILDTTVQIFQIQPNKDFFRKGTQNTELSQYNSSFWKKFVLPRAGLSNVFSSLNYLRFIQEAMKRGEEIVVERINDPDAIQLQNQQAFSRFIREENTDFLSTDIQSINLFGTNFNANLVQRSPTALRFNIEEQRVDTNLFARQARNVRRTPEFTDVPPPGPRLPTVESFPPRPVLVRVGNETFEGEITEGPSGQEINVPTPPPSPDDRQQNQPNPVTTLNVEPTFRERFKFQDFVFDLTAPYSKKTIDKINAPIGTNFIDVQPVYNFFIDGYEQTIEDAQEALLPNMYAFLSELDNENTDEKNTIFRQHITLADTIPDTFVDITNNKGEKIGERDKGQYFDKYARAFGELMRINPSKEQELVRKFSNIIAPMSNIDLFKDFNEKRELFPMYFDISFSTERTTEFAQILFDSHLSSMLLKDIVQGNIPKEVKGFRFARQELRNDDLSNKADIVEENIETDVWDLGAWIEQLADNPLDVFESLQDGVFLGKLNNELKLADNPQFDLHKNLLILIFLGKLKKLIERKARNVEEIFRGESSYSEVAFYHIEKRDAATNEVIQNFYLPNSNDIDVHRFIDTQVKYNKEYTYNINAIQFVIGNEYEYLVDLISIDSARCRALNKPILRLVKVPYYSFTGRVMDAPPVIPDVVMIPYYAVNNRIKIDFNSGIGEFKLDPIVIEPTDEEIIRQLREAQMVGEENFLRYASDDAAFAFEIFRLDRKPTKYSDFTGNRIALVETDINSLSLQKATSASFIDNVLPNKRYYYIFRTIDNHGHISNPTPIHELRIVDDNGMIFPVVKIVDFDTGEDTKSAVKPARKFIQIIPSFPQTILNEEKSGLIKDGERIKSIIGKEKFHLGVQNEGVWNKQFKIRLTSKQTGRKIDFNIEFRNNFVKKIDNEGKIVKDKVTT